MALAAPRFLKRALAVAVVLSVVVAGALAATWRFVRSPGGREWIRARAMVEVNGLLEGGVVTLGPIEVEPWSVTVGQSALADGRGRTLVGFDRLEVAITPELLLEKDIEITRFVLTAPLVQLEQGPDGVLDLARVLGLEGGNESTGGFQGFGWDVRTSDLVIVDGHFAFDRLATDGTRTKIRLHHLGVQSRLAVDGDRLSLEGLRAEATATEPSLERISLVTSGSLEGERFQVDDLQAKVLDLTLGLEGALEESPWGAGTALTANLTLGPELVHRLTGERFLLVPTAITASLDGDGDLSVLEASLTNEGGVVEVRGQLLSGDPPRIVLGLATVGYQVDDVIADMPSPLSGTVTASLSGPASSPQDIEFVVDGKDLRIADRHVVLAHATGQWTSAGILLQALDVDLPEGQLHGNGPIDPIARTAHLDVGFDATLSRIAELPPELAGEAGFEGTVDASWHDDVDVKVKGTIRARRLGGFGLEVPSASGEVEARLLGDQFQAEGSLRAATVRIPEGLVQGFRAQWSATGAQAQAPAATADWSVDEVVVRDGALQIDRVSGSVRTDGTTSVVDATLGPSRGRKGSEVVLESPSGTFHAELGPDDVVASVVLLREGPRTGVMPRALDGQERPGPAVPVTEAPTVDGELLRVAARVTPADGAVSIDALVFAPEADQRWTLDRPLRARRDGDRWKDVEVALRAPDGTVIALEGEVGPRDGSGRIAMDPLDLDQLKALLSVLPEVDDLPPELHGAIRVTGSAGFGSVVPTADLTVSLSRLEMDEAFGPIDVEGHVQSTADALTWTVEAMGLDGRVVDARGSLGRPALACDVPLEVLAVFPAQSLSSLGALVRRSLPEGALSAEVRASGTLCEPELTTVLALQAVVEGSLLRLDAQAHTDEGTVQIETTLSADYERRLRMEGTASTRYAEIARSFVQRTSPPPLDDVHVWIDAIEIDVVPLGVPLAEALALLDQPRVLGGRVAGGFHVTGDPVRPTVAGGLQWVDGRVGDVPVDSGFLAVIPGSGGYALDGRVAFKGGGSATISGKVPVEIDLFAGLETTLAKDGLDVLLDAQDVPLSTFTGAVDGVSELAGTASVDAHVTGTLGDPVVTLEGSARDGSGTLDDLAVRFEDLRTDVRIVDGAFVVEDFRVSTKAEGNTAGVDKKSTWQMTGGARLVDGSLRAIELEGHADRLWLSSTDERQIRISGDLSVTGDYPALAVRGSASASDVRLDFGPSFFEPSSGLEIDPTITVHRESAPSVRGAPKAPPFWSTFDVDVSFDLQRNVRLLAEAPVPVLEGTDLRDLSNVRLDSLLGGAVEVRVSDGVASVEGQVETLEGSMELFGNEFTIGEGTISFVDPDPTRAYLALVGTKDAGEYGSVEVRVNGSLQDMEIDFDAESYPDDTDVVSLLLFGVPASEIGSQEGQANAQVMDAVLSSATSKVEDALGSSVVDEIEIAPDLSALRVGKALGDRLFLSLELPMKTDASQSVSDENLREITLEYLFSRSWYAEVATGDQGSSRADLYWRIRF